MTTKYDFKTFADADAVMGNQSAFDEFRMSSQMGDALASFEQAYVSDALAPCGTEGCVCHFAGGLRTTLDTASVAAEVFLGANTPDDVAASDALKVELADLIEAAARAAINVEARYYSHLSNAPSILTPGLGEYSNIIGCLAEDVLVNASSTGIDVRARLADAMTARDTAREEACAANPLFNELLQVFGLPKAQPQDDLMLQQLAQMFGMSPAELAASMGDITGDELMN